MQHYDQLLAYLMTKPEALQDYPFGPGVLVLKVQGKMFALLGVAGSPIEINLKCEPQQALMLRDIFAAVRPGYHMNKTHWNTVTLDGSIPDGEVQRMIDHSYALVVKSLTKAKRKPLELLYDEAALYQGL